MKGHKPNQLKFTVVNVEHAKKLAPNTWELYIKDMHFSGVSVISEERFSTLCAEFGIPMGEARDIEEKLDRLALREVLIRYIT